MLHPPTTKRRTVALETGRQHLHLSDRSATMQRREMKMRHAEWKKPFYGSPIVKEIYRCVVLKQTVLYHLFFYLYECPLLAKELNTCTLNK